MNTVIDFNKDLGTEPDASRGVALDKPIELKDTSNLADGDAGASESDAGRQSSEDGQSGRTEDDAGRQDDETQGGTPEDKEEDAGRLGDTLELSEFAERAGWEPSEVYDMTIKTDDGPMTITALKDGYRDLSAENETLRQERQQTEAKATQPAMQQYDPRAVELMNEVQQLQKNYDAALNDGTFDGMEAAEAMRLQMRYKDAIDQRTRAAQKIQGDYVVTYQAWAKDLEIKVDAEIRDKIKEFRNPKVRAEQTGAMKDMLRSEYGVDEGRWNGMLMDPVSMRMIHDLWTMKAKQAEVQKGVRKIQKVPKALKPAARQSKAGLQSAGDVGKAISSAKGRRQQDKILFESEFDDSLLR